MGDFTHFVWLKNQSDICVGVVHQVLRPGEFPQVRVTSSAVTKTRTRPLSSALPWWRLNIPGNTPIPPYTPPGNTLIPLFLTAVGSVYYLDQQQTLAVSSGPESESVFQVDAGDHQLSHLYGLVLWGETPTQTFFTLPTGRNPELWLAEAFSADCREWPIGCFHQMWSRVLQPVSERRSDIITHLSHVQEETDAPPVPPPLHLTSLWCHHSVFAADPFFFFYREHETFSQIWLVVDNRYIIDVWVHENFFFLLLFVCNSRNK